MSLCLSLALLCGDMQSERLASGRRDTIFERGTLSLSASLLLIFYVLPLGENIF